MQEVPNDAPSTGERNAEHGNHLAAKPEIHEPVPWGVSTTDLLRRTARAPEEPGHLPRADRTLGPSWFCSVEFLQLLWLLLARHGVGS